jgi:hypothetical protein
MADWEDKVAREIWGNDTLQPHELRTARINLGLTLLEMARLLGYGGKNQRQICYSLENGLRTIRDPQRRLVEAYLAGYRPADWPKPKLEDVPPWKV